MKNKKVALVTGASGSIGSEIVKKLLAVRELIVESNNHLDMAGSRVEKFNLENMSKSKKLIETTHTSE